MPRVPPTSNGRRGKPVQAVLVIQYRASRASAMTHTATRDQAVQEKVQTRKIVDDLKALNIIADGFYPCRYEFEWKHGMVHVGWRLREGSFEHLRLQFLIRRASETMEERMRSLDIANIKWLEDSKRIPMHLLPTDSPQEPENENRTPSTSTAGASGSNIVANKPTILPPLAVSRTGGNIQFIEVPERDAARSSRTCKPMEQPTTPLKPQQNFEPKRPNTVTVRDHTTPKHTIAGPFQHHDIDIPPLHVVDTRGDAPPDLAETMEHTHLSVSTREERTRETEFAEPKSRISGSRVSGSTSSHQPSTSTTSPSTEDHPKIPPSPKSPNPFQRSDFELVQNLLVEEICKRKDLERIIEVERQYNKTLTAVHAGRLRAFDEALNAAQNMHEDLEAQLADAQANSMQLESMLLQCRAELEDMQDELVLERKERLRVTAVLERVRREREIPLVPALTQALSLVDGLTSRVVDSHST